MSERSELLKKVLDTWEHSEEGRGYLEWLLRAEAVDLDGGDVLREAVLDVIEEDDELRTLRWTNAEKPLTQFCTDLAPESARVVRETTEAAFRLVEDEKKTVRKKAEVLRHLRHGLNRDRLEALQVFAQIKRARERELPELDEVIAACGGIPETTDVTECEAWARKFVAAGGMEAFHANFNKKFAAMEEVAARAAGVSRTSVEPVDAEAEWQRLTSDEDSCPP